MDRLQFLGSINQGNFVMSQDNIIQFFDHIMAAYNLVGSYHNISVMSNIESPVCMSFNVSCYTPNQATGMMEQLASYHGMDLYGKHFQIHSSINGNALGIQILQS